MALSGQSEATVLFSAVCYTFCDTYCTLTFPVCQFWKVNFLKFSGVKPSYGARATADCRIPEFMKFRLSHIMQMENCLKVTLIRQSHRTNR
jgi:hypothetical protein